MRSGAAARGAASTSEGRSDLQTEFGPSPRERRPPACERNRQHTLQSAATCPVRLGCTTQQRTVGGGVGKRLRRKSRASAADQVLPKSVEASVTGNGSIGLENRPSGASNAGRRLNLTAPSENRPFQVRLCAAMCSRSSRLPAFAGVRPRSAGHWPSDDAVRTIFRVCVRLYPKVRHA